VTPDILLVKGSSPSSAGRHTGAHKRPAAGPRLWWTRPSAV